MMVAFSSKFKSFDSMPVPLILSRIPTLRMIVSIWEGISSLMFGVMSRCNFFPFCFVTRSTSFGSTRTHTPLEPRGLCMITMSSDGDDGGDGDDGDDDDDDGGDDDDSLQEEEKKEMKF